jgi:hypothetical protein
MENIGRNKVNIGQDGGYLARHKAEIAEPVALREAFG